MKTKIQLYLFFFSVLGGAGYFVYSHLDSLEQERKAVKSVKTTEQIKKEDLKSKLSLVQKVADKTGMGEQFKEGVKVLTQDTADHKNIMKDEITDSTREIENTAEKTKVVTIDPDAAKIDDEPKWWNQKRERKNSSEKKKEATFTRSEESNCPACPAEPICEKEKSATIAQASIKGDLQVFPEYSQDGFAKGLIIASQGNTTLKDIQIESTFSKPVKVKIHVDIAQSLETQKSGWIQKIYPNIFEHYSSYFDSYFPPGNYKVTVNDSSGKKTDHLLNIRQSNPSKTDGAPKFSSDSAEVTYCLESIGEEINTLLRDAKWLSKAAEKNKKKRVYWVAPVAARLNGVSEKLKYSALYKDEKTQAFLLELLNLRADLINESKRLVMPSYENIAKMNTLEWRRKFEHLKARFEGLSCQNSMSLAVNIN